MRDGKGMSFQFYELEHCSTAHNICKAEFHLEKKEKRLIFNRLYGYVRANLFANKEGKPIKNRLYGYVGANLLAKKGKNYG